jgi:hypothetical protein
MVRSRQLLSVLLFGVLLLPQVQRAGGSGCEAVRPAASAPSSVPQPTPARDAGCGGHHPGADPLPAGMEHCALSLSCASAPALVVVGPEGLEILAFMTVRLTTLNLPVFSSSPQPQAPPPRS